MKRKYNFKTIPVDAHKKAPADIILNSIIPSCIETQLKIYDKKTLFSYIAGSISNAIDELSSKIIEDALWERENIQNTWVGHKLALPHARIDGFSQTRLAFYATRKSINYNIEEGNRVNIFIVTIGPKDERELHLKLLGELSSLIHNTNILMEFATLPKGENGLKVIEENIQKLQKDDFFY